MSILNEWRFRFRLAWDHPVLRWVGLGTIVLLGLGVLYTGIRVITGAFPSGFIVSHYTVYQGIDQVVPLPWFAVILILPLLLVGGTLFSAFSVYRQDAVAGFSLLAFSVAITFLWLVYFFYFIKINT